MRRDDSDRLFDQRVVRRNISAGRIQKDDYKRFMDALPDVTDKIKPTDEGGDDDGWDGPSQRDTEHVRPHSPLPRVDFGARAASLDDDDDDDDLDDDDDDDLDDDDDDDLDDDDLDSTDAPVDEAKPADDEPKLPGDDEPGV